MRRGWRWAAFALPLLVLAGCGGGEETPDAAEIAARLLEPQALADNWLGDPNAPVTIIEYASMTCPHCRAFHETVFDDFIAEFVDTGQVRFVLREFPLDTRAAAAIMLARCAPGESGFYALVDHLFETQGEWATADAEAFLDTLFGQVEQAGFTRETFDACLANQELLDNIVAVQNRGAELGVNSTPTFFINGAIHVGEVTLEELRVAIEAAR
jgi:protein-disulfide isomerase